MATQPHIGTPQTAAPLPPLAGLKINGMAPFWSHPDGINDRLGEAHAILSMLADRHDLAGDVQRLAEDDPGEIRHEIRSRALQGVATLIALALYHADCATVQQRGA